MKLGIVQPYFFPYIGYWQLINAVDRYVIYDDVNYINRGWINRNRILLNGEPRFINVQMKNASQNKLINEVELHKDDTYTKKLVRTLETCYGRAPYFKVAMPFIESIIKTDETSLARYLELSIRRICEYLSIETEIVVSSQISKNKELKGQERIIDICKGLGAHEYINPIGGQALYSRETFDSCGIKLNFHCINNIKYRQFTNEFVPNLSIIDVMMFNDKDTIRRMLTEYELA